MNTYKRLLIFLMLCLSLVCRAQMFTNIRTTQTLTVRAIVQTNDGCIWFGAGKTLYCFDGAGIRAINSDVLDKAGAIGCVAEDGEGNVLIGCERGLVTYDKDNGECLNVTGFEGVNVRSVIVSGKDEWIGTSKGLFRNRTLLSGKLNIIAMVQQGDKLLVSCMDKFEEYDTKTGKFVNLQMPSFGFLTCFMKDGKGNVMAGSVNGVWNYAPKRRVLSALPDTYPVVKCMIRDANGKLMVGCDGGLFEIGKNVKHIAHDARNSRSLAGNVVWCMTADKQGNIWVGTDNGLSVMTSSQDFCIYPLSAITESGKGNQVYCMLHDSKDRLWLGGSNGIVKVDELGKAAQSFAWFEMNNEQHPIPHNRIRLFYEDPVWGVWACTDGGLLHYDEESGNWLLHLIAEDEHNWIYNVEREAEALIVTTFNAVYRVKYDKESKSMNVVQKINAKPSTDNCYSSINIGDTEWAISANGLRISNEKESREIELPEKFVSIYYNADNDLIYLGGSDIFATINPKTFAQQEKTSIWFDADARFVGEDEESGLTKGLIIGIVCVFHALIFTIVLYYLQQKRMKIERARRKAMLKSAREKMRMLESDKNSLQQQLYLQQLTATAQSQQTSESPQEEVVSEEVNADDVFMVKVTRMIEENIDNPDLSVALLAEKMGISSKQLYRKVKQCTDLTAVEYIRKLRLQKAALLLKNPEFTINEVMYMVGFSNPSYFSRSFAGEYGMPPSEWRN